MPGFLGVTLQRPDMCQVHGHSYVAGAVGTADQTGRFDNVLLSSMGTDYQNRRNHGVSGSVLVLESRRQGGWANIFHQCRPSRGAPFTGSGGMRLLCYGINDVGVLGDSGPISQMQACYVHAMRACISRIRASTVYLPEAASGLAYGAGFTSQASANYSGTTFRQATVTTAATVTWTIPTGYNGEPLVMCFLGMQGPGGTVTFSGTGAASSVSGTLVTGSVMPSATLSRVPMIKRITGLTSAAAGATIIATATAFDASGFIWFDSAWVESKSPPVVLVCDINRLTAAGYAFYSNWTGTEAKKDVDVQRWNGAVNYMISTEFDNVVEIIPLDAVVGKDASITFDGIHLNEKGSSLAVDAMLRALGRVEPIDLALGSTANLNVPSDRLGSRIIPRVSGNYYAAGSLVAATTYPAVTGDMFSQPFEITQARSRWIRFCLNRVDAVAGTITIRWGIFNDTNYEGYPKFMEMEHTAAGVYTVATAAGPKESPDFPTIFIPEPGIWHLVVKFVTISVAATFQTLTNTQANPLMPALATNGAPLGAGTHPQGWKLTGQGTGVLPDQFPTGAALSAVVPAIGIKLV